MIKDKNKQQELGITGLQMGRACSGAMLQFQALIDLLNNIRKQLRRDKLKKSKVFRLGK